MTRIPTGMVGILPAYAERVAAEEDARLHAAWANQARRFKWAPFRNARREVRAYRMIVAGYRAQGHPEVGHYEMLERRALDKFRGEARKLRDRLRHERAARAQKEGLAHLQGIFDQAAE